MLASGDRRGNAALQFRIEGVHPIVEIVLPLAHGGFVAEYFLCGQPTVFGDRHKAEVHVRRLFVHVNDGRDHVLFPDPFVQESGSPFKELPLLFVVQLFHNLRRRGNQRFYHDYAVAANATSDVADALHAALLVLAGGLDQMVVLFRLRAVDIRIALVFFLLPLVVTVTPGNAAGLCLLKSQDCIRHSDSSFRQVGFKNISRRICTTIVWLKCFVSIWFGFLSVFVDLIFAAANCILFPDRCFAGMC